MRFPHGSTVKLVNGYANALMRSRKARGVDWIARRGTVIACADRYVYVMWPGTEHRDPIPVNAVELA